MTPRSDQAAPGLGVVVVTYESSHQLPGLLTSLSEHCPGAPVQIVDNASYQPTEADIEGSSDACLIRLSRNVGYGAAANVGVREIRERFNCKYVALVNPDVRFRGPTLQELVAGMDQRPECAVAVGPAVGTNGERQTTAWAAPNFTRALWYSSGLRSPGLRRLLSKLSRSGRQSSASTSREAFRVRGHVLGGAMTVRASAFEAVGGFDETYFLYWEDADLCTRLRRRGFESWYVPVTPVLHRGGQSSQGINESYRRMWYARSARHYASRHLNRAGAFRLSFGLRLGSMIHGSSQVLRRIAL